MALLLAADALGPYKLTMRLTLISLPWAFYKAIFLTCWDCYDFEAVAAQQIGHLLGLGQTDLLPTELLPSQGPPGQNSYHAGLASGLELNATNCATVWDGVLPGIPPGLSSSELNPSTGNRWALMDSMNKHNPRTCLTADDLEGLNVIYPTCTGAVTAPQCHKQSLYFLGWFRICIFVIGPIILAICTMIAILGPHHLRLLYLDRKKMRARARVHENPPTAVSPSASSSTVGAVEIIAPPPASTGEVEIIAPPPASTGAEGAASDL